MASAPPPPSLSAATTGWGTQLYIDIGAGMVRVAEIDDIPDLPSKEQELYETSNFDSVELKEWKKMPLSDGVEIEIGGNYVIGSEAETTLKAAEDNEGAIPYELHLPQGDEDYIASGYGLFYSFRRGNSADSKRRFSITLKPVTEADFSAAAGV